MKLAVCARGEGLDAEVDQRFGRCAYFVLVDTESGSLLESVSNKNAQAAGGAGPQAAQLLSGLNVDAVAVGNLGPNAAAALQAAKVKVYGGVEGTVAKTLQKFIDGNLSLLSEATVDLHSGMKDQ